MRPQHITAENPATRKRSDAAGLASMRPQHITAENVWLYRLETETACFNEAAAYHCGKRVAEAAERITKAASMRPQHITAENEQQLARGGVVRGGASMRPQHITAENMCACAWRGDLDAASMRPQHITAENSVWRSMVGRCGGCFNEAAAYHCGKRAARRDPAGPSTRFNEAAAYHCGKPVPPATPAPSSRRRFNEAAAYHCGKRRSGLSGWG